MAAFFNPADWYWTVAGHSDVYGSRRNIYVPTTDPDYLAWLAINKNSGTIDSEASIWTYVNRPPRSLPEWMFDGTNFAQPADGAYTNVQLAAYTADARWRKEQGGITATAGFPIKTDDRAQAKITGVYAASKENPAVITPWHAADGTVHDLDAAGMFALNSDLLTHINHCFSVSAGVLAEIETGAITTPEQIDNAFNEPMSDADARWLGDAALPKPGV